MKTALQRRSRLCQLLVAVVLAGSTFSATASADPATEASLLHELGAELYKQGRYAEALEKFIASNRLVPNRNVVLNIARTFAFLERHQDAFNWYTTLLEMTGDDASRISVTDERAKLLTKVGAVHVTTTPSGAELYIDRKELGSVGKSPRDVGVAPGQHRIIAVLDGCRDTSVEVEARVGSVTEAPVALEQIVGKLVVSSNVEGARVQLADGRVLGSTPLETSLAVGRYELRVGHPGFSEQRAWATVEEAEPARLELSLKHDPATVATLSVRTGAAHARISLDGKLLGVAPLLVQDLTPGDHRLSLSGDGLEPWTTVLPLEPGGTTRVDARLADPRAATWSGWRWIGYGGSAALLAAGGIVGITALNAKASFEREPSTESKDRMESRNRVADVLFASGAVVGIVTGSWDFFRPAATHSRGNVRLDR
ncbi:MAG TPA: PEGA domain-containing protein [Polyangiaceae bacterium]|nr:PEGA domain-containing protein [Polyangiaceae bacterium]